MYKQQIQTKLFFDKDAKNWQIKSDVNKNKFLNTIQERNFYVVNQFKKLKINSLIDVGCGTGDLSNEASKIIKKSVGIDFSKNMIKLAHNKFKRKNLELYHKNFFDIDINERFDCLSANGFIEYLSLKDIDKFIKFSKKIVKQNKFIIFGTRNRLFNLFSLNKFSDFIKLKKNRFEEVLFKQPKTGIDVDKRHQFSPLQLVDILKRNNWEPLDFYPINYHPVVPTKYNGKESKFFSNYIYLSKESNKLPFIPFSSSFMVLAKNK